MKGSNSSDVSGEIYYTNDTVGLDRKSRHLVIFKAVPLDNSSLHVILANNNLFATVSCRLPLSRKVK